MSLDPSCFNFSNLLASYKLPIPSKILLFNHVQFQQYFIHHIFANYRTMRDMHHDPAPPAIALHLMLLIASYFNASLVSHHNVRRNCTNLTSVPMVHVFNIATSLQHVFNKLRIKHGSKTTPATCQLNPFALNYAYCNVPSLKLSNLSPVGLFETLADLAVWISLRLATTMVWIMLRIIVGKQHPLFIPIMSALICPGICGQTKRLDRVLLFTIWVL